MLWTEVAMPEVARYPHADDPWTEHYWERNCVGVNREVEERLYHESHDNNIRVRLLIVWIPLWIIYGVSVYAIYTYAIGAPSNTFIVLVVLFTALLLVTCGYSFKRPGQFHRCFVDCCKGVRSVFEKHHGGTSTGEAGEGAASTDTGGGDGGGGTTPGVGSTPVINPHHHSPHNSTPASAPAHPTGSLPPGLLPPPPGPPYHTTVPRPHTSTSHQQPRPPSPRLTLNMPPPTYGTVPAGQVRQQPGGSLTV